jgi:hypothetical protein
MAVTLRVGSGAETGGFAFSTTGTGASGASVDLDAWVCEHPASSTAPAMYANCTLLMPAQGCISNASSRTPWHARKRSEIVYGNMRGVAIRVR